MRQIINTPGQIGEILRGRRKARRLSQTQLSSRLGMSQERLSRLETDPAGMTLERLIAIARMLDLDLVLEERPGKPASGSEW